jgi:hypothetical protein
MRTKIKIPPKLTKLSKFKQCYIYIRHKYHDVIRFFNVFQSILRVSQCTFSVGQPIYHKRFSNSPASMYSTLVDVPGGVRWSFWTCDLVIVISNKETLQTAAKSKGVRKSVKHTYLSHQGKVHYIDKI